MADDTKIEDMTEYIERIDRQFEKQFEILDKMLGMIGDLRMNFRMLDDRQRAGMINNQQ